MQPCVRLRYLEQRDAHTGPWRALDLVAGRQVGSWLTSDERDMCLWPRLPAPQNSRRAHCDPAGQPRPPPARRVADQTIACSPSSTAVKVHVLRSLSHGCMYHYRVSKRSWFQKHRAFFLDPDRVAHVRVTPLLKTLVSIDAADDAVHGIHGPNICKSNPARPSASGLSQLCGAQGATSASTSIMG